MDVPRLHRRQILALLLIASLTSGVVVLPPAQWLNGLSIDMLTWLRWATLGPRRHPVPPPVAIVVFDEDTYRSKPFAGTPSVAWTREIGRVITAIVEGGARVIGLDVVSSKHDRAIRDPVWCGDAGGPAAGFDRDFLRAVASAAAQGKLVLGEVQAQERPLGPSDAQRLAVANRENIRPLNLYTDPDGIVAPHTVDADDRRPRRSLSMDVELAARMQGVAVTSEHGLQIGTYRVPEIVPNTLTLNFDGGSQDLPTYAFVDLWRCWENGDAAYFQRHFAGRVVLLGVWLDLEDRVLTSKRFATGNEQASLANAARGSATRAAEIYQTLDPGRLRPRDGGQQLIAAARGCATSARLANRAVGLFPVRAFVVACRLYLQRPRGGSCGGAGLARRASNRRHAIC